MRMRLQMSLRHAFLLLAVLCVVFAATRHWFIGPKAIVWRPFKKGLIASELKCNRMVVVRYWSGGTLPSRSQVEWMYEGDEMRDFLRETGVVAIDANSFDAEEGWSILDELVHVEMLLARDDADVVGNDIITRGTKVVLPVLVVYGSFTGDRPCMIRAETPAECVKALRDACRRRPEFDRRVGGDRP